MSFNLVTFIKSLLPSLSKSEIESDMETSLEAIDGVNDAYVKLSEVSKVTDLKSKQNIEVIKEFYKEFEKTKTKVKLSHNRQFAGDIVVLFQNIKLNGEFLLKEISDTVNDVIMSQALTSYRANLLRSVGHYYFMTKYAMDLANYIYTNEVVHAGLLKEGEVKDDYLLNKKQVKFIEESTWIFARLVAVYGKEHADFKANIEKVVDINIPKDEVETVVDFYGAGKIDLFDNLPPNFISSPIYSIGLVFAQWEADRYKKLTDQKKLLELRRLHLVMLRENGNTDVNIEKQIGSLQDRIVDIDYKIAKIEQSVDM